jgi:hypothetical protein
MHCPCNNGDYETLNVVGPLSSTRRQRLEKGLRTRDAFELRRCQSLLASASSQVPPRSQRTSDVRHKPCATRFVRTEPT